MLNFRDERVFNLWRNTPRWPMAGAGPIAIPTALLVPWVVGVILPFHKTILYPTALLTVSYIVARVLKVPFRRVPAYLAQAIRGRRYSGMAARAMRSLLGVVTLAALVAWGPAAHAEFRLVVPPKAKQKASASRKHAHRPSTLDDVIQGYGHGMRFSDAVDAIIPGDWKAKFTSKTLANTPVDWVSHDRTVRDVLAYLSNQADAQFAVNKEAGTIRFSPVARGYTMTAHGVVPSSTLPTYTLRSGHMLKEELARWAKAAGWHVGDWPGHYEHKDYPITVDAPFHGRFQQVVTAVVDAYQKRGGLKGIVPHFSTANKVVSFELMH